MAHNVVGNRYLESRKLNDNLSLDSLIEENKNVVKSKLHISTGSIRFKVGSVEKLSKGQLIAIYHSDLDVLALSKPFVEKFLRNLKNYDRRNLQLTQSQENLLYFMYMITEDKRFIPYIQSIVNGGYEK